MIMNGKNYSEEIKKLLIQNSKSIDERLYHRKAPTKPQSFLQKEHSSQTLNLSATITVAPLLFPRQPHF